MLLTLTSLSGAYCIANTIFIRRNMNLLKQNMFMTLHGTREFKSVDIRKEDTIYKLNWIEDKECMLYKQDFLNCPYKLKYFDNVDDCKQFCLETKIKFNHASFNKIKIEKLYYTGDSDNICMLTNGDEYTIVGKMTDKEFKKYLVKNNQLPFNKLNMLLFIALIIYLNYLNYQSP